MIRARPAEFFYGSRSEFEREKRPMKKPSARTASLLILAAMLFTLAAALLPTAALADEPAEIDALGFQALSTADVLDDETDLRFVFKIGSLAYSEVGIICSKTVQEPTRDAKDCYTYRAKSAYSSIMAGGEQIDAGAGRWWIAVKLTSIPHSYFAGTFYLRAFVLDGGGVRYSDVKTFTVCSALGHEHELPWDAPGTATIQTPGTLSGHCDGCNLDLSLSDVKREPIVYNSAEPSGPFANGLEYRISKNLSDVRGEDHFYPTQEHPDGQDLWFEYSFLWNASLENWDWSNALAEIKVAAIFNTAGKHREFFLLYTRDNNDPFKTSNDCPYEGHFDYSAFAPESKACVLYGPDSGYSSSIIRSSSPYVYDETWFNRNGWHRIGVRHHLEAAKDGGSAVYSGFAELYLDGVLVWRINSNVDALASNGLLLFTAEVVNDELVYHDNDDAMIQMKIESVARSTDPVYVAVGDIAWSCGSGFVLDVEREPFPEDATLDLDTDLTVSAPFCYRPKAAQPENSFTVATWNIGHFSNGISKNSTITDGGFNAAAYKYRTYVNDVLGADIVCLNEYSANMAKSSSHPARSELFGAYTEVAYEGEQRNYSCNALYSKLPLSNVTVHEFACNVGVDIQYTNAVEATDYYYITGELEIGGETVVIVVAHLAYDDYLYEVEPYIDTVCQDEICELIEVFRNVDRVLILGDFNAYSYDYFDLFADAGYTLGNRNRIPTCTGSATGDLQWSVDNMVAKGLTIRDFRGEPTTLSDHVAVIATVALSD